MNVSEKFLFGLAEINITVEDRDTISGPIPDRHLRYKHMIVLFVLNRAVFSATIRSSTEGMYFLRGTEL